MDVCPNRANVEVIVPGKEMAQIVHVDIMCNECGNCKVFCPYNSAPYQDKFTVFATEEEFDAGSNQGLSLIHISLGLRSFREHVPMLPDLTTIMMLTS